ncbi:Uncharacterized protein AC518_0211 [Pseudomonas syringae pv. syringae]|nr:Uncharacterized protein AC518_0211 [Pseudomonas syringae pv. syringae]
MNFTTATHRRRQCGQGRLTEQRTHVGTQADLTHTLDEHHRQQRMAAQFEEVIIPTDPFDRQYVRPDRCQQGLDFALRGFITTIDQRLRIRRRQRLAIELAVGSQRQRIELHVGCRHHVVRQRALQVVAQVFDVDRLLRCDISHQTLVAGNILTAQHHGFTNIGVFGQARFDFTQFNAETTNLHLIVIATQVLQIAVGAPANQVARAVNQRIDLFTERIDDKLRSAQLIPIQIALGNALPADIQLAGYAQRHWLALAVEHIQASVAHRFADRDRAIVDRHNLVGGGERRGFGRAITIEQMLRRVVGQYPCNHCRVQHIAADNQVAQA